MRRLRGGLGTNHPKKVNFGPGEGTVSPGVPAQLILG